MSTTPPAGWYHDPTRPGTQRWWDGTRWTAHAAPVVAPGPAPPPLASFGQRLGAYLLDLVILMVPIWLLVLTVIALAFGSMAGMTTLEPGTAEPSVGVGAGVAFSGLFVVLVLLTILAGNVLPVLYGMGFEGGARGQTIGKWALGIRVVDARTADRLAPGRALVRQLVRTFASGFLFLGFLWMLWDDQQRTWHDMAGDTRVVVSQEPKVSFGQLLRSWTLRSTDRG